MVTWLHSERYSLTVKEDDHGKPEEVRQDDVTRAT